MSPEWNVEIDRFYEGVNRGNPKKRVTLRPCGREAKYQDFIDIAFGLYIKLMIHVSLTCTWRGTVLRWGYETVWTLGVRRAARRAGFHGSRVTHFSESSVCRLAVIWVVQPKFHSFFAHPGAKNDTWETTYVRTVRQLILFSIQWSLTSFTRSMCDTGTKSSSSFEKKLRFESKYKCEQTQNQLVETRSLQASCNIFAWHDILLKRDSMHNTKTCSTVLIQSCMALLITENHYHCIETIDEPDQDSDHKRAVLLATRIPTAVTAHLSRRHCCLLSSRFFVNETSSFPRLEGRRDA